MSFTHRYMYVCAHKCTCVSVSIRGPVKPGHVVLKAIVFDLRLGSIVSDVEPLDS